MFSDRNLIFTQISDKLHVREYVANKIGNDYLIPLLWRGENPYLIPFDSLPDKFVIKANHGCGYNIIVKNKAGLDFDKTRLQLNKWLNENFCTDKYLGTEWGYKNIKRAILVESLIEENGEAPKDYKFWCFSGRVECISIHFGRYTGHTIQAFDRNFESIDFGFGPKLPAYGGKFEKPTNFEKMLDIAESLAEGFSFIRVDLYSLPTNIYFGELTLYPGGVSVEFVPDSWDYTLGEKWKGI